MSFFVIALVRVCVCVNLPQGGVPSAHLDLNLPMIRCTTTRKFKRIFLEEDLRVESTWHLLR